VPLRLNVGKFMICDPPNIIQTIKKNEMFGACGTYGGKERCI